MTWRMASLGRLLLNVSHNTTPFRVGMLAPVGGGRLIRLLISPEDEQTVHLAGQTLKATVFRIHPELGGIVGADCAADRPSAERCDGVGTGG